MTSKEIVRQINEGFASGDNESILKHIADNVRWNAPGNFFAVGKDEFRKQLNNDQFEGIPSLVITNEIVEGNRVAVEGTAQCRKKDGSTFNAVFCDVYLLADGQVKEMTSYLIEKK